MALFRAKVLSKHIIFDANLLSGVEVYTSNVPASLGGFTGGAVVAETRQYSGEDRVKLSYRTTQSEWAEMQVPPPPPLIAI
ncbi:hypothetical protein [Vibrio harveyi]|uniref:hypothetical protein n=1 Tax=Vibrio harveyi TaxID=669 RepID=UPI00217D2D4A|nr:hypothetical protein [Vibrio harveyi]